jgi:hypothetical protein
MATTVADKLLSSVPWLNLGGAVIFLIDAFVYGVDFWLSL